MKGSTYPDFLGIGAQKSGTTWLSHNLRLHPQIRIPELKEVHYFDDRIMDPANPARRLSRKVFGKGPLDRRWRRIMKTRAPRHLKGFSKKELFWDLRYFFRAPTDEWYASLFEREPGTVTGEITPAYATLEPDAVAHVHDLMPDAKIIFMMRNPIERAWSQAARRYYEAGEREDPSAKNKRLQRHFDSDRSRLRTDYSRTLETWNSVYQEDRIFVGFFEDVYFFPAELMDSLYRFLGVDPSFRPPGLDERVHARSTGRVPVAPLSHLARVYREEITQLDDSYRGYASFWRFCAERLVDDLPGEESIPYPLYESSLWEEWAGSQEIRFQSSPLFAARRRADP